MQLLVENSFFPFFLRLQYLDYFGDSVWDLTDSYAELSVSVWFSYDI